MEWTTETAFQVCFVERVRLLVDRIRIECRGTIAMRWIVIEVAVGPVSQPFVLGRSNRQIIHAEIVVVSECVTVKRRQLDRLLWCGRVGGISEPVEIRRA